MKFGKFAQKFDVSKDTLRYYIKNGLLLPKKKGGQYSFDSQSSEDMEFILSMKEFGFTIDEINKLISLKRNLHPRDYRFNSFILDELDKKKSNLKMEIDRLYKKIDLLEKTKLSYLKEESSFQKLGVSINLLKYLTCPSCGFPMDLDDARIEKSYIMSAKLKCSNCDSKLYIEDGIIVNDDFESLPIKMEDLPIKENYEYWLGTHLAMNWKELKYLNQTEFQRVFLSYQWLYERLVSSKISNRPSIIMTSEINSGRFLFYHLLNKLDDKNPLRKSFIIVVLPDKKKAKKLKNLLETLGTRLDLAIICANPNNIPIKEGCVDIFLDDYSSFYYLLREKKVLMDDSDFMKYLSKEGEIFGILPEDFFSLLRHLNMGKESSDFLGKLEKRPEYIKLNNMKNNKHYKLSDDSIEFWAYHYDLEGKLSIE